MDAAAAAAASSKTFSLPWWPRHAYPFAASPRSCDRFERDARTQQIHASTATAAQPGSLQVSSPSPNHGASPPPPKAVLLPLPMGPLLSLPWWLSSSSHGASRFRSKAAHLPSQVNLELRQNLGGKADQD